MKVLDPLNMELNQACLIEASAGTGKTYTITTLYVRLVSQGFPVDGILVVTFTEAAAAELKLRIRQRLAQWCIDPESPESDIVRQRIRNAVVCFDQACIMTIHSFCLQTLKENAFESSIPFSIELVPDSRSFLKQVSHDFFACHVNHYDPVFLKFLKQQRFTPDTLFQSFGQMLSNPDLPVIPGDTDFQDVSGAWRDACVRIKEWLISQWDEIYHLIADLPGLDKRSYPKKRVADWLNQTRDRLTEGHDIVYFDMSEKGDPIFRFTRTRMASKLKDGDDLPDHEFFDLCEQLLAFTRIFKTNIISLKRGFMAYFNAAHDRQKAQDGICYFDDLISDLAGALSGPRAGDLVSAVRKKYRACLIDEFQDTDLKQYRIFSRIFLQADTPFCMIGDPKQAIYAFRGGDIFAYLNAVSDTKESFTLAHNYRSDPLLVDGINHLFRRIEDPFGFDQIRFSPVKTPPGAINRIFEHDRVVEPLQFAFLPGQPELLDSKGVIKKDAAGKIIPGAVARDLVDLLHSKTTWVHKTGVSGPVRPGDIAILVRKNRQALDIQSALTAVNIPSYLSKTGSVFDSDQARDLADILKAVLEPENTGFQRTALCSGVFGLTGDDLAMLDMDENVSEQWQVFFRNSREIWKQKGFIHMMNVLLHSEQALLSPNSDIDLRSLTNYYHLMELLHRQAVSSHLTGHFLLKWLEEQMTDAFRETDADELRLESDGSAVAIVTIHKSKGLEYPVVFLPYLWEGSRDLKPDDPVFFHDPGNGFQLTLDLGSDTIETSRELAAWEMQSEETRLLYVALTRAVSMCRIYWGNFKSMERSALASILHAGGITSKEEDLLSDLDVLAAELPRSIRVETVDYQKPLSAYSPAAEPEKTLTHAILRKPVTAAWKISSFSQLIRDPHDPVMIPSEKNDIPEAMTPVILADFPKGPGAGDFFHSVFEDLDFSASTQEIHTLSEKKLAVFGLSPEQWGKTVAQSVLKIVQTPLHPKIPGCSLEKIPLNQRLNELEFMFRVDDFQVPKLVDAFKNNRQNPALSGYADRICSMDIAAFKGFIKGFIDLVFRHERKWYILDYKSNYLGDHYTDYSAQNILEAMTGHHYFLQYHIYAVALHRYLEFRLPSYAYDTHFGGVLYLFIRGMHPDNEPGTGIYFDRPDERFINRLSDRLQDKR